METRGKAILLPQKALAIPKGEQPDPETPQSIPWTKKAGTVVGVHQQQSCLWYADGASVGSVSQSSRQHRGNMPPVRTWVIAYPSRWGPPRRVGAAPARGYLALPIHAGLGLTELPIDWLQSIMDLLPTFADRAHMCAACKLVRGLEWRLAPPLLPDEELSGIGLGNKGTRAIACTLARPQRVVIGELCLGCNGIGDDGARAIAAVLAAGSAIRRLSLRDNEIGDVGAQAIAKSLSTNSVLEEIDLWGNRLTDVGKRALLSAARCMVFLELDAPSPRGSFAEVMISGRMRSELFDWVSEVHTGGNAPLALDGAPDPQDMLFRTFSHTNAYLACNTVQRTELRLIGAACTLVATGLHLKGHAEESELATWLAFMTGGGFTADQVRNAAHEVQQVLDFKLHQPTAYTFLRRYLRRTGWTEESFSLANYLIELAVIDHTFIEFRPQTIAAAAAILSRQYLSQGTRIQHIPRWKSKLLRCAQVDLQAELAPCAAAMGRLHASEYSRPNKFVNKKYEWARLHMVAKIMPNHSFDADFFMKYMLAEEAP